MTNLTTLTIESNGHRLALSEHDEFDSQPFEGDRESIPYIQMLNHQDPMQAGFFITAENMEVVGFIPNDEWSLHTATFQSGETATGDRAFTAIALF